METGSAGYGRVRLVLCFMGWEVDVSRLWVYLGKDGFSVGYLLRTIISILR